MHANISSASASMRFADSTTELWMSLHLLRANAHMMCTEKKLFVIVALITRPFEGCKLPYIVQNGVYWKICKMSCETCK